jgi:GTP-binding protein
MFIDRILVRATAGKGGNGAVAWSRAKYIPKGGPAGGDGGKGGAVIFQTDPQISSLEWYQFHRILKAENGQPGSNKSQRGRNGINLVVKVPCGTVIKDAETGEILCDLIEPGKKWVVCEGGLGGRGNESFKSPTNQAPAEWTPGEPGQDRELELELKIIADVGLLGFPNAGKSTLLSEMAKIDVKTAAYPFTTLSPNLGYVEYEDYSRIYFADIPGIIEGAHNNRGLGLAFLRHIERTECLLYVLDASLSEDRSPWQDFCALREELKQYNSELLQKKFVVVLNKIDLEESKEGIALFRQNFSFAAPIIEVSALEGIGLDRLKIEVYKLAKK